MIPFVENKNFSFLYIYRKPKAVKVADSPVHGPLEAGLGGGHDHTVVSPGQAVDRAGA